MCSAICPRDAISFQYNEEGFLYPEINRENCIECFLCGMTRACIHLLHFDFKGAFSFHPLSFIVFPILCFIVLQDCINIMKSIKKS